ncbi:MAG: glycosyltransferase family 2 protein [Campylobacteraceae bacterium]|jgi:glycosyltransferase involved in cell wall biosynthesis|nr:glycosyltransferase family 2 protein [Campylobacteraceae bacterium]
MESNKLLSIAIPTYNRAIVVKKLLTDLIPKVKPYDIAIYISDNASPDNTQSVIEEMKAQYRFIYSNRNEMNVGGDRNFEKVLKMSSSQYTWLLGDDDTIDDGGIEKVLEIIKKNTFYDLIIVNGIINNKTTLHLKTKIYTNHNELIEDLWPVTTWMSTLILSNGMISNANFCKYYDTNFVHSGTVFDYLATKDTINVFWEKSPIVIYPKANEIINNYTDKSLFFFGQCWVDILFLLPDRYLYQSKLKVARLSPISILTLASLRAKNYFNYQEAKKYRKYFKYTTSIPFFIIAMLSISPTIVLKFLEKPARYIQQAKARYIMKKNSNSVK